MYIGRLIKMKNFWQEKAEVDRTYPLKDT